MADSTRTAEAMAVELESLINTIPPNGWWNEDTHDTYLDAAKKLIGFGMRPTDAVSLLSNLWTATAAEYGE